MDGPQVGLVGHPVGLAAHEPEDHAACAPSASGSGTSSASSASTDRLICHQVRTLVEPGVGQPAVLALVVGERAGVDLLDGQAARGADRPGLRARPSRRARRSSCRPPRRRSSRSTMWTKSIRPSARSCTLPQARIPPSASRTTTFSRISRPCSEPRPARRPRTRPPSRGRRARGRAAARSAARPDRGRHRRRRRPPSPRGSPGSSGSASAGSLSNRLSSGITRIDCALARPVGGQAELARLPVAAALPGARARTGARRSRPRARRRARSPRRRGPRSRPASARGRGSRRRPPAGALGEVGATGLGVDLEGLLGDLLLGACRGRRSRTAMASSRATILRRMSAAKACSRPYGARSARR